MRKLSSNTNKSSFLQVCPLHTVILRKKSVLLQKEADQEILYPPPMQAVQALWFCQPSKVVLHYISISSPVYLSAVKTHISSDSYSLLTNVTSPRNL